MPFLDCTHIIYFLNFSWWRHQMETFSCYWPFVCGFHRSPTKSPHKGQWRRGFRFPLISAPWINGWVSNREAGDLRRYRAHYDVTVMYELWYTATVLHLTDTSVSVLDKKRIQECYTFNFIYQKWISWQCKDLMWFGGPHGFYIAVLKGSHITWKI